MKYFILIVIAIQTTGSFAQQANTDTLQQPVYDTTRIELTIRSLNTFYFCNKLYKVFRDCDTGNYPPNCCSYQKQVDVKNKMLPDFNQLSCYNGTSLTWNYLANEAGADESDKGYMEQMEKQMKQFEKQQIDFYLCDKKIQAYKIKCITAQGGEWGEILGHATINNQVVSFRFSFHVKEIKSNDDISANFKQLLHF